MEWAKQKQDKRKTMKNNARYIKMKMLLYINIVLYLPKHEEVEY